MGPPSVGTNDLRRQLLIGLELSKTLQQSVEGDADRTHDPSHPIVAQTRPTLRHMVAGPRWEVRAHNSPATRSSSPEPRSPQ